MGPVSFDSLPLERADRELTMGRLRLLTDAGIRAQIINERSGDPKILVRREDMASAMRIIEQNGFDQDGLEESAVEENVREK